jgi:uncharacterized protein YcfJ
MKPNITLGALGVCVALTLVATGCGAPKPREERVVRTTTTYTDDYRRRPNERLYTAPVTQVHAVFKSSEERCWVERERVSNRRGASVGGAVAGAVIGGILGHQIGSGRGRDAATAGGAIAGGAVGANVGRRSAEYRDVKHCETVVDASPEYWDVTYEFRGVTHHVQMTDPPGRTVTVNSRGEPRV